MKYIILSLMLFFSACSDAVELTPAQAEGGYQFQLSGETFFVGLFVFPADPVSYPDILQPFLLVSNGSGWDVASEYSPLWIDAQEDIFPNPENAASAIISYFNEALQMYDSGGVGMSWNQKLVAIFELRLVLNNNQLSIKSA